MGRQLIDGLGLVLATYARIDEKVLVEGLSKEPHGVQALQRRAEQYRERLGRPVPECVAAGVVDIYNRHAGRKRNLVKWWKVHEGGRLRHRRGGRLEKARSDLGRLIRRLREEAGDEDGSRPPGIDDPPSPD